MKCTGITQIFGTSNKVLKLLSVFHQKLIPFIFSESNNLAIETEKSMGRARKEKK